MPVNRDARKGVKPPAGVPKEPPTGVDTSDSLLAHTAPTLKMVKELTDGDVTQFMDVVNINEVEKRTTLLARLIIEDVLWHAEGLTKKERADIAMKAIATLEGTKNIWIQDDSDVVPHTEAQLAAEKDKAEKRLEKILERRQKLNTAAKKRKAIKDALIVARDMPVGEA